MYGDKQAYNMQKCRTGTDFENFIVTLLTQYGFDARKTGRDDKGVDIIATKNVYKDKPPLKFFIQCKFWKSTIGIGPINEVIGGALYRGGDGHKVIITNNRLTGEAKAYAKKMGVEYISEFEFNELALCEKHQKPIRTDRTGLLGLLISCICKDTDYYKRARDSIGKASGTAPKKLSSKEERRAELISAFDQANILLQEAAEKQQDAFNFQQQALAIQKEALLKNLDCP